MPRSEAQNSKGFEDGLPRTEASNGPLNPLNNPTAAPAPFHGSQMTEPRDDEPFRVLKRNKRLWVVDAEGRPVYTPPDFIRLQSREPMWQLARSLSRAPYIVAVMNFEATCAARPQKSHGNYHGGER